MQDPLACFSRVATIGALLSYSGGVAEAQSVASIVPLHGQMTTTADVTDKFVFHVPATNSLTIRVPIPQNAPPSDDQTIFGEQETIGSVAVVQNMPPRCESEERDSAGNLYKVLSYDHLAPGVITVSAELRDVRLDDNLDGALPDTPLPLQSLQPQIEKYLSPTRLVQSDDMRIVLLAHRIVGGSRSEADAAQAITLWLQKRIGYSLDTSTERHTDAVSTLVNGEGLCEGWAHLFLALARADGIPCRYVGGYYIGGDIDYPLSQNGRAQVTVFTPSLPHAWVDVWYPGAGWVPYDPQSSAGFVDTHHVPIWTGLDGDSNLPILTWQPAAAYGSECSFAEQESTANTSDASNVRCSADAPPPSGSGAMLFTR